MLRKTFFKTIRRVPLPLPQTNAFQPPQESIEQREFRNQVAAWLQDNRPADPGFLLPQTFMEVGSEKVLDFLREWQHKVWSAGYLGMAWPKQYGGQSMGYDFQRYRRRRDEAPASANLLQCYRSRLGWAVDSK